MRWLYRNHIGERIGPVTQEEISALIANWKVDRQTMIAPESTDDWRNIDSDQVFVDAFVKRDTTVNSNEESARVHSDTLPTIIKVIGSLSAFSGIVLILFSLMNQERIWLLSPGLTSLFTAPFLFGFADIITSLRKISLNTSK